jgi:hypothetical protein
VRARLRYNSIGTCPVPYLSASHSTQSWGPKQCISIPDIHDAVLWSKNTTVVDECGQGPGRVSLCGSVYGHPRTSSTPPLKNPCRACQGPKQCTSVPVRHRRAKISQWFRGQHGLGWCASPAGTKVCPQPRLGGAVTGLNSAPSPNEPAEVQTSGSPSQTRIVRYCGAKIRQWFTLGATVHKVGVGVCGRAKAGVPISSAQGSTRPPAPPCLPRSKTVPLRPRHT